jgi:hypothetical protein
MLGQGFRSSPQTARPAVVLNTRRRRAGGANGQQLSTFRTPDVVEFAVSPQVGQAVLAFARSYSSSGPKLGSQISSATDADRFNVLLICTAVMALVVVCTNRIVWRPLYRLAETRCLELQLPTLADIRLEVLVGLVVVRETHVRRVPHQFARRSQSHGA